MPDWAVPAVYYNGEGKEIVMATTIKMSVKNILIWFADQMKHPATLFIRKSWGVFSVYAHIRRSDRLPKKTSQDKVHALKTSKYMSDKYGGRYSVYKCVFCDGWHIAKESAATQKDTSTESQKEYREGSIPKEFNLEGILISGIPDIASVYGGVRGRTLSSPAQSFAWPIVKECGVKTIIDLREDGIYTRMQDLCDKFGMEYFYYPVDKKVKHVKDMVTLFPKFCSLIDEGRFYIACAMGLHRTDIALCAYWVFYSADKGMAPPEIRGYQNSGNHKIMRVLNAMYKELQKEMALNRFRNTYFTSERKQLLADKNIFIILHYITANANYMRNANYMWPRSYKKMVVQSWLLLN